MKPKGFFCYIIFLFFCSISFFTLGQNKADSLLQELSKFPKEDTNRANILNKLGCEYVYCNPDKAHACFRQAMKLCQKIGFVKAYAISSFYDGVAYKNQGNYKKALDLYSKTLWIYNQLDDKKGISKCLNGIGSIYEFQGNYTIALSYFQKSLQMKFASGDKKGVSVTLNNIGTMYMEQGNYMSAMKYFILSSKIYEEINDKDGIATSMDNIGTIYYYQGNFEKAAEYFQQSLVAWENAGNKKNKANTLNSLGVAYAELKSYDKTEYCFRQALKIREALGDKSGIATSIGNIGLLYEMQGNYPKAMNCYLKSLKITEDIGEKKSTVINLNYIGLLYRKLGDFSKSLEYHRKSLDIAEEIGSKEIMLTTYKNLAEAYEKMGDFSNAYKNYRLYSSVKDSILNIENSKKIIELQAKYETAKKEKTISELEKEKQIQNLNIEKLNDRRNGQLIIFIIALAFVIITAIILYNRYKIKQKERFKTQQLKEQELRTWAVIEAQEQERTRIARELHDGIGLTLASIKINFSSITNTNDYISDENKEILQQNIESLDNACKEVRSLSHQMMPKALQDVGLTEAMEDLLEKTIAGLSIKYTFEKDNFGRLDETIEIGLYRIFQELLNNILKHAKASEIAIYMHKTKEYVLLMVEDNGIGMEQDQNYEKNGIGLSNIEARVHALKGTFSIGPGAYHGIVASVKVPCV
jgi:two-component system, NarL family, sensor kinase